MRSQDLGLPHRLCRTFGFAPGTPERPRVTRPCHSRPLRTVVAVALLVGVFAVTPGPAALAQAVVGIQLAPGSQFSIFAGSKLTRPIPVRATDGRIHLVYELVLTSTAGIPVAVDQVEVRDARSQRLLLSLSGEALAANMNPLAGLPAGAPPSAATTVGASGASIVWFDVTVRRAADVPRVLEHLVSATTMPPSPGLPTSLSARVGNFAVRNVSPIALGPPVGPGIWVADEGCCVNPTHHRRSLLAIDGQLVASNRFAIDWFRLDSQHRAFVGDPSLLSSYFGFNQPVIAAADGTVVEARDGLPNSVPPHEPVPPPPLRDLAGNHVTVRVAPGLFLLYAHLTPGSVSVRLGQRVSRGEVLGRLGNSGLTSTPHLHFHVQTTVPFLPTDSVPFVFDRFDLLGQITVPFSDETLSSFPVLPFAKAKRPGPRQLLMPLDRNVLRFSRAAFTS